VSDIVNAGSQNDNVVVCQDVIRELISMLQPSKEHRVGLVACAIQAYGGLHASLTAYSFERANKSLTTS